MCVRTHLILPERSVGLFYLLGSWCCEGPSRLKCSIPENVLQYFSLVVNEYLMWEQSHVREDHDVLLQWEFKRTTDGVCSLKKNDGNVLR